MTGLAFSICAALRAKRPISADRSPAGVLLAMVKGVEDEGVGALRPDDVWKLPTARAETISAYRGRAILYWVFWNYSLDCLDIPNRVSCFIIRYLNSFHS